MLMQKKTFFRELPIFLAGAALMGAVALGGTFVVTNSMQRSYLFDQIPKECSGYAVEFRGRKYAPPLEEGKAKSLDDGITYASPPRGTGYIHIAKKLGYPNPECFGNAMKNYNELHGKKKGLKREDVILVPEIPEIRQANNLKQRQAAPALQ